MNSRKVLVTGGAGYVGSVLVPNLLKNGFRVRVYDTFWYGNPFHDVEKSENLELVEGDIRDSNLLKQALIGCTDVIHLACISNDPSYDLNPKLGEDINFLAFEPLVKSALSAKVERFIYASSSSVYGVKNEKDVTETLSLNPLTDYSKFKALCEPILLKYSSAKFITTIVRPATICGFGRRQRLDLSVNILTNYAVNKKMMKIYGGGQFRPNLHIDDMSRAYIHLLNQPAEIINGQIFNVGAENLSIKEIADIVASEVGGDLNISTEPTPDKRSYRVSSNYIKEKTGFVPIYDVKKAVQDLIRAFSDGLLPEPFSNSLYYNLRRMSELEDMGRETTSK